MLPYERDEFEHDLLLGEEAHGFPCWESFLCAHNRCIELYICALGDAGNKVVCCWVEEVYP